MRRSSPAATAVVQGLLYALVIAATLALSAALFGEGFAVPYRELALLMAAGGFVVMRRYDLLTPWMPGRQGSIGTRICWAWVGLVGAILLLGYVMQLGSLYARKVLLVWFLATPVALLLLHRIALELARRFLPGLVRRRTAVMVFVNDAARGLAQSLRTSPAYELVGFFEDRDMDRIGGALPDLAHLGKARSVPQYVRDHGIEVVFIVLPDDGGVRAIHLLDELGDTPAAVYYVPDFLMINLFEAQIRDIEGVTVLEVAETPFYGADGLLKRLFDLVLSVFALALLGPLMLIAAVLIRLTSAGPVILRDKRYGLNGQRFHSYRLRTATMSGAGGEGSVPTSIGRLLRRVAIDQLPQLINVLRGEMSVVGPRAHTVAHNEFYRKAVKRYMVRHRVKPGLTGWAQVHGLGGETAQVERMEERIRYDLDYIKHWSPLLDLRVVLMALAQVLREPR